MFLFLFFTYMTTPKVASTILSDPALLQNFCLATRNYLALIREGKCDTLGCTNYAVWRIRWTDGLDDYKSDRCEKHKTPLFRDALRFCAVFQITHYKNFYL